MDVQKLGNLNSKPISAETHRRAEHRKVFDQLENYFARQMIKVLRETSIAGEEGGIMGKGIGSETYASWFDENMADHLTKSSRLGIAEALMTDFERNKTLVSKEVADAADKAMKLALEKATKKIVQGTPKTEIFNAVA